jgi:hypothetical protein
MTHMSFSIYPDRDDTNESDEDTDDEQDGEHVAFIDDPKPRRR